ncbi:MAG: cupin domain-containing protein [Cyanobacteria bacterium K_DeepCast_0m_m1_088]|nr:cupin domain-containing protein [Cyanobacteria bacterium K_DeepCast_0m_m1_088]
MQPVAVTLSVLSRPSVQQPSVQQPFVSSQSVIERYGLRPHPEGGWYREVHRSSQLVSRSDGSQRAGLTVILFLLEAGQPSAWHRVHGADESWHFIGGDPLKLLLMRECDQPVTTHLLGFAAEQPELQPVAVVPAGWWQAAHCQGDWSLVSCCVGPGFDFQDFELDAARQLHS